MVLSGLPVGDAKEINAYFQQLGPNGEVTHDGLRGSSSLAHSSGRQLRALEAYLVGNGNLQRDGFNRTYVAPPRTPVTPSESRRPAATPVATPVYVSSAVPGATSGLITPKDAYAFFDQNPTIHRGLVTKPVGDDGFGRHHANVAYLDYKTGEIITEPIWWTGPVE